MARHPVGTEARGRARRWIEDAARRHAALRDAAITREVQREVAGLLRTQSRPRAALALRRLLAPFARSFIELRRPPVLVATSLWPCGPLDATPTGADDQDHVVVVAFGFGAVPGARQGVTITSSPWGFAVTRHAIERLVERDPTADVGDILLAAHRAVLAGSRDRAIDQHHKLLIPAANEGVFIGRLVRVTVHETAADVFAIASTFVSHDMIYRDQETLPLPSASRDGDPLAVLPISWQLPKNTPTSRPRY
jgi:hypothetical protein